MKGLFQSLERAIMKIRFILAGSGQHFVKREHDCESTAPCFKINPYFPQSGKKMYVGKYAVGVFG